MYRNQIFPLSEDDKKQMVRNSVWSEECPVPLDRLSVVSIRFRNFEGEVKNDGKLIIFDVLAPTIVDLFEHLREIEFPIKSIRPLHEYGGDDEASMDDNNSSCFNFRTIPGGGAISMHGYGMAIDINPLQNPFVTFNEKEGTAKIKPKRGWEFLNRHNLKMGMVEEIAAGIQSSGFTVWGGRWTTPVDYHHFQPPRAVAELLTLMSREHGERFWKSVQAQAKLEPALVNSLPPGSALTPLLAKYDEDPEKLLDSNFSELLALVGA